MTIRYISKPLTWTWLSKGSKHFSMPISLSDKSSSICFTISVVNAGTRYDFSNSSRSTDDPSKHSIKKRNNDDLFDVYVDDADLNRSLGPRETWPPVYKRDLATGRILPDIESELSETNRRVLDSDALEQDRIIIDNIEQHWQKRKADAADSKNNVGSIADDLLNDLGRRIRETQMRTNVLGRSVSAQMSAEIVNDGSKLGRDDSGFSSHLTPAELKAFKAYMELNNVDVGDDSIPVQDSSHSSSIFNSEIESSRTDDIDRSLQWLTLRANSQMDESSRFDNPFADLMPGDLTESILVNRKRAKAIPRELLHHNNVELLQYFMTPAGQIKNRMQSGLGAKDQRKIAKLIKRARAIGLLPIVGDFKVERHGWIHSNDINKDRHWEKKLAQRGLLIERKSKLQGNSSPNSGFDVDHEAENSSS